MVTVPVGPPSGLPLYSGAHAVERAPWLQVPGEPTAWYARFLRYVGLGRRRSVLWACQDEAGRECQAPQSWYVAARIFRWQERADAYDLDRAQRDLEAYEAERVRSRTERRGLLNALREKLADHLDDLDYVDLSWQTAAQVAKVVTSELRAEHNDLPAQPVKQQVTGAGDGPIKVQVDVDDSRARLLAAITRIAERQREAAGYLLTEPGGSGPDPLRLGGAMGEAGPA